MCKAKVGNGMGQTREVHRLLIRQRERSRASPPIALPPESLHSPVASV